MVEDTAKRIPCEILKCVNNMGCIKYCIFPASKDIINKAKEDEKKVCPHIIEFLKSNKLI